MTFDTRPLTSMLLAAIVALSLPVAVMAQATNAPARSAAKPIPKPKPVPRPMSQPAPSEADEMEHDGAPIICGKRGCLPLPPNCHAEREDTWEGPTGYQIIVCP